MVQKFITTPRTAVYKNCAVGTNAQNVETGAKWTAATWTSVIVRHR